MTITADVQNRRNPRVVVVGSMVVDRKFFEAGEYATGGEDGTVWHVEQRPGGIGRNVAINLARLGARVSFVAVSGDDERSRELELGLRGAGVSVTAHRVPDGLGVVELFLDADRNLTATTVRLPDRAESLALRCGEVERLVSAADGVVVETGLDPRLVEWLRNGSRRGGAVLCGLPSRLDDPDVLAESLSTYDVLVLNHREAARLLGRAHDDVATAERHARLLRAHFARTVVVTCGSSGALLIGPDHSSLRLPAGDGPCRDDTGAGDALAATFLAHLLRGGEPGTALRHGMSAATLTLRCRKATCVRLALV
ncbi:ribokinase [Actinopolyspora xinjiangensis]|uniref:Ribokinase n=1 Tax=Actinopolyspora xinjiangensis TaxID=405564 RepID=A0A1H0S0Y7_9ACTN|nr:PfkB family carbohydrate kinase [Actinopolyspora xinjiangensis]SDP35295.1 ribokinase [Actinopolyspora xinjiangensis]